MALNYAQPHNSRTVLNYYLREQQIGLMPHPPYSLDLAPCDYWLFGLIKRGLTDQKDDNILFKSVFFVQIFISEKEYKKTNSKLVGRYKLCIKKKGEYNARQKSPTPLVVHKILFSNDSFSEMRELYRSSLLSLD